MTLNILTEKLKKCKKCNLSKTRINTVVGEGNKNADIIFVGEAPGKNEDEKGTPFCGASGKILNQMLESINLKREDVYITNIVKCRPPKNRDPLKTEIKICSPFLKKQIEIIKPKIVISLGRHAMYHFFPKDYKISDVHGKNFKKEDGIIYMPLYHPAACLYNGKLKTTLFKDFENIKSLLKS